MERTANVQTLQCEGSGVFREEKGRGEAWNVGMRREDELKHEGGDRDQTVCSLRGCGQGLHKSMGTGAIRPKFRSHPATYLVDFNQVT